MNYGCNVNLSFEFLCLKNVSKSCAGCSVRLALACTLCWLLGAYTLLAAAGVSAMHWSVAVSCVAAWVHSALPVRLCDAALALLQCYGTDGGQARVCAALLFGAGVLWLRGRDRVRVLDATVRWKAVTYFCWIYGLKL